MLRFVCDVPEESECDAVVYAADPAQVAAGTAAPAPGVSLEEEQSIFAELGPEDVRIAYASGDLYCTYMIHTPCPRWQGGEAGEREALKAVYGRVLKLAEVHDCRTLALPLISAGACGFPEDTALDIAVEAVESYDGREMDVELLLPEQESYDRACARLPRYAGD